MSGFEIVGLIGNIIGIIEVTKKVYDGVKDTEKLPDAFGAVAKRLPLVQTTLRIAKEHIGAGTHEEDRKAMEQVVKDCKDKAEDLCQLFKSITPSEGMPALERYRMAVRRLGKGNKVEVLAKAVMEDVRALAENRAVQSATETQASELLQAIKEISAVEPSLQDEDSGINQVHHGSGDNVGGNKFGGNHNENHGSGTAYFGSVTQYHEQIQITQNVHNPLYIQFIQKTLMKEIRENPLNECLKSLFFVGMDDQMHKINSPAAGTCGWLLQHEAYAEWVHGGKAMLCVKGNPGSGKSTLLRHALDNMAKSPHRASNIFLSFFCAGYSYLGKEGSDELTSPPAGLFRLLLHQLLSQAPELLTHLVELFRKRCETMDKSRKSLWHPREFQRHFNESLNVVSQTRHVWLFVDGLYEWDRLIANQVATSFNYLSQELNAKQFRSCFSCRHYPELNLDYDSLMLLDDEKNIEVDIKNLIQYSIPERHRNPDIENLIIDRAQGLFMWAHLTLEKVLPLILDKKSFTTIKAEIEKTPERLEDLYREIIRTAKNPFLTKVLMEWLCFSSRPLTTEELRWAITVHLDRTHDSLANCKEWEVFVAPEKVEMRIKVLSCGLAEVVSHKDARVVQFIHPSIKRFMIGDGLRVLNYTTNMSDLDAPAVHLCLSRTCIHYLRMAIDVADSLVHLTEESKSKIPFLSRQSRLKFPFLHYATKSWVIHAKLGDEAEASPGGLSNLLQQTLVDSWGELYKRLEPFADDCPPQKGNLIHVSSNYGLTRLLSHLLDTCKEKIDSGDELHRTPLMYAAKNGHETQIKALLASGADVNKTDKLGRTSLFYAAKNGHEEITHLLLKRVTDTDSRDVFGRTPLLYAAKNGHTAVVKLLLGNGSVDADARDNYNQTPLSLATEKGHAASVESLLDTNMVNVDARDIVYGQTPLSRAAWNGDQHVVELLLNKGKADVNDKDKIGRTSLFQAAEEGHSIVTGMLLNTERIDVDVRDTVYHQTPLSRAAGNGHGKIVEMLLGTSADVDAKDKHGQTPLSRAAEHGHEPVVKLLLDTGKVEVDARDETGRSSLSCAAENGHVGVVEVLLATGKVNVDSSDKQGQTPLLRAAGNGHKEVVKLLRKPNTDKLPSQESGEGYTTNIRWYFKEELLFARFRDPEWTPERFRLDSMTESVAAPTPTRSEASVGASLDIETSDGRSADGESHVVHDLRWQFKNESLLPKPRSFTGKPRRYRAGMGSTRPLDLSVL